MDSLNNLADGRLVNGCIYCGGNAETRDHVPSRVLLERPYPKNLPVVGACRECNFGFSKDEEYLVCLLEVAKAGSTDPEKIRRRSVARSLARSPALRARLEAARRQVDDRVEFAAELERVQNVMLKLVRGHAAFELSRPCRRAPDHIWFGPLNSLSKDIRETFDEAHVQEMIGEVGSRNLQRMLVTEMKLTSPTGEDVVLRLLINDWIDVQDEFYRYLAIDDAGGLIIRIVIGEYFGCEAMWGAESLSEMNR